MKDISLGALPDKFLLGRLEHLRRILDQVPLGRGGQGNAEVLLEGLQAVEGDAVAILAVGALVKRLTAKIFGSAPVEGTVRCLTIGG